MSTDPKRSASYDKYFFHPGGHVKIHAAPNQMYDCPLCGVEFEHISSLKDHVPSHKVGHIQLATIQC